MLDYNLCIRLQLLTIRAAIITQDTQLLLTNHATHLRNMKCFFQVTVCSFTESWIWNAYKQLK